MSGEMILSIVREQKAEEPELPGDIQGVGISKQKRSF
jgi:hypothetical protein